MSRGHGRIQRQILDLLDDDGGKDVFSLARAISESSWPSHAERESVRRALKTLVTEGVVWRHVGRYNGITYRLSAGSDDQHLAGARDEVLAEVVAP